MRVHNNKNLLAFFTFIDTATGLEYRDFKLCTGKNGIYVSSPSQSYEKDNETKYVNQVQAAYDPDAQYNRNPKGVEFMEKLAEAAYAVYQSKGAGASQAEASARGPAPSTGSTLIDDQLPF